MLNLCVVYLIYRIKINGKIVMAIGMVAWGLFHRNKLQLILPHFYLFTKTSTIIKGKRKRQY